MWRSSFWEKGIGARRELAAGKGWGAVPASVALCVVQFRKNKMDTRMGAAEVWGQWAVAFEQLDGEWDELYLAEFPEVSQPPPPPGSPQEWVAHFPVCH